MKTLVVNYLRTGDVGDLKVLIEAGFTKQDYIKYIGMIENHHLAMSSRGDITRAMVQHDHKKHHYLIGELGWYDIYTIGAIVAQRSELSYLFSWGCQPLTYRYAKGIFTAYIQHGLTTTEPHYQVRSVLDMIDLHIYVCKNYEDYIDFLVEEELPEHPGWLIDITHFQEVIKRFGFEWDFKYAGKIEFMKFIKQKVERHQQTSKAYQAIVERDIKDIDAIIHYLESFKPVN